MNTPQPHTLIIANDVVGARMAGPSIRAWEMARALYARGLDVTLAAPGDAFPPAPFPIVGFDPRGQALRAAAARADAILVQGLVLAHFPFLAALDVPLVVDVYDPFVFENLAQRVGESLGGRQRHHASDLAALNEQLGRGDFFLCASETQRDYWIGMLTALGRVNPATYDADPGLRRLIDVVPFGLAETPPRATAPVLKGVVPGIGPEDRVILWGGGIWSWFDPLTLIRAVAVLARDRADVRLVFMGTRVPSLYAPKRGMAERAEALARELGLWGEVVHFNRDWVPYEERAGYLLEADVGASCHLAHVEARYAFRTRLLDCFWAGLPMLVTGGDVLADLVAAHDLGRVVPPEDLEATVDALGALLDDPQGRSGYAPRFALVREQLGWSRAVAPLAGFLAQPCRAADRPTAAGAAVPAPTPRSALPVRAVELWREGGPLLLAEEAVRYLRWLRRPRA